MNEIQAWHRHFFFSVIHAVYKPHCEEESMNETSSSGWDYHTLKTVNPSSGGESLMQWSKTQIDSS